MRLEDAHLHAALAEAWQTLAELEQDRATTAAAAWWSSILTLRRFLENPHCLNTEKPTTVGVAPSARPGN